MKFNMTIPEGTRDQLYGEAELYENLGNRFNEIYEAAGCARIITPAIENHEMFVSVNRSLKEETVYKLTENTGRLLVLRPDNTTPIARVVATKLKSEPLPQKLYYNQPIYRINSDYSGMRSEVLQSGIEIVGASGIKSDLQCIITALEALDSIGLDYKLEIGHVGYFNALIADMNLTDDEALSVRSYVEAKNYVSLNMFDKIFESDVIRKLPLLYGGDEVFAEAEKLASGNADAIAALDYVKKLYEALIGAGYGNHIMVDMSMVHKFDYYTGAVIRGYLDRAGEPVLKGGRYDKLLCKFEYDVPATGFAINVSAVADALVKSGKLPEKKATSMIIHYDEDTFNEALAQKKKYNAHGVTCELTVFDTFAETEAYAKKAGIETVVDLTGKAGR